MKQPLSLRSTFTALTILVAVFAVVVSGALVGLTTTLQRMTASSAASVESVRLAEEAEIDLLLHERADDALVRRDIEGNLQRRLVAARRFVTTEEEAHTLTRASERVEAYMAAARDPERSAAERAARQEGAYGALDQLVAINVAQSRAAHQDAARWSGLANLLGIAVGALFLVAAGVLLVWLRGRAFEPVLGLAAAMERFGRGDHDARAAECGPQELREMCGCFNEMASALAAQRQAQLAFLGGVAHDLRTPLSVLKMSFAILEPGRPHPSEERARQAAERFRRQITRMERMLGDFLDVAKIEAGQLELRLDTHDARKIVNDAVELFDGAGHDQPIGVRLPDDVVPLRCDHLRIEQVITNLVSNAIKYSPPGSPVEVVLDARGHELELSVTDHGVGISEADRRRVFEPFRRVGQLKESVTGVGLGLFVVRKIVEAHQGRIQVESAPSRGSTFRVVLPIARELVEQPPPGAEDAPPVTP